MRSRFLQMRLWLESNGILPLSRLALVTGYLLAFDVLIFLLQKIAAVAHWRFGDYLGGWVTFLSLVVILCLLVLAKRKISARLLWRMRNRLIVTYIFIGIVPLLLLVSLGGLALYLFAGQFATYMVTSRLDAEFQRLQAQNSVLAAEIASNLNRGRSEVPDTASRATSVAAWINGEPLAPAASRPASVLPPGNFPPKFTGIVRDGESLFIRSVANSQTSAGRLTVVSSTPLSQTVLLDIASGLGQITLEEPREGAPSVSPQASEANVTALRPTLSVGSIPASRWLPDFVPVTFSTSLAVQDWATGQPASSAAIDVQTTGSALYDHLFSSPGAFAATVETFLLVAALVFAFIELIALWIGTKLTRTVTGAVSNLYVATTFINRGDFSHRVPITSNDQLAALAGSFNLMTESIERLVLEQKEKQRLENEITIAQEVQAQLFPHRASQLSSLEVHGFCRPARSVSGDYYDFLPLGSDRLVLAVGDVSGKGISAALLMATIHSAVRAYSIEGIPVFRQAEAVGAGPILASKYDPIIPGAEASPATMLTLLNRQLYVSTPMEKYATMFLGVFDGDSRRLTFSNAGHLPPLLLDSDGNIRRLERGGTVVGLFDEVAYDEGSVQMHPGDIFLAYSDGVTEPENEFGEFGEARLLELVRDNRHRTLEHITEIVTAAVDDWIGAAAEQPDDITLVLARAR